MSIYEIIMTVLTVLFGGLSLYIQTKKNLNSKVVGFINEAEEAYKDTAKAGGSKHQYVVEKLYSIVPVPLRVFITKAMIESIVDKAFEKIEGYATKQLDKVVNKIAPETDAKPVETPVINTPVVETPVATDSVVVSTPIDSTSVTEPAIDVTTETDVK